LRCSARRKASRKTATVEANRSSLLPFPRSRARSIKGSSSSVSSPADVSSSSTDLLSRELCRRDTSPLLSSAIKGLRDGATGRHQNDGSKWHFHWVVLTKDSECGPAALKVKDIEAGTNPKLPETWPGAPILIDSPGYKPHFDAKTVRVTVAFDTKDIAENAQFDGVTTALKVNGNLHAPLLCVSDVFKIGSGDLSLPGKATPAAK
jgi:hypothetical protein